MTHASAHHHHQLGDTFHLLVEWALVVLLLIGVEVAMIYLVDALR
jgi:hypothetical protein